MTIGKKLYVGFGAILAIILFLFLINIYAVMRQSSARDAVKANVQRRPDDRGRSLRSDGESP